jgi:hypothetical protein
MQRNLAEPEEESTSQQRTGCGDKSEVESAEPHRKTPGSWANNTPCFVPSTITQIFHGEGLVDAFEATVFHPTLES